MKVLLARGNPNKLGVSERLADIFACAMESAGAEVFDFDVSGENVRPCSGCGACNVSGKCAVADAMGEALDFLLQADALVCVSPVYFRSMSSQMKKFFDRCYPLVRNGEAAATRGKKFVAISAASGRIGRPFETLSQTYRATAEILGMELAADIRRGESPYFTGLGKSSARVGKILRAFARAGREFAASGNISPETVADAEMTLSPSAEIFEQRAKLYWELSKRGKVGKAGAGELKQTAREVARKIASAAKDKTPTMTIAFPDAAARHSFETRDTIKNPSATAAPGATSQNHSTVRLKIKETKNPADPDIEISAGYAVICDILASLITPAYALKRNKLRLRGSAELFTLAFK